jgi:hypothetical protein
MLTKRSGAVAALLLFCLVAWVAAKSPMRPKAIDVHAIGEEAIIHSDLDEPIGVELVISGRKTVNGPLQNMFFVETVNGRAARRKVMISVNRINDWPDGTTATLRGYEEGTLRYLHARETNVSPEAAEKWVPRQTLFVSFQVEEVVEPRDLKVDKR